MTVIAISISKTFQFTVSILNSYIEDLGYLIEGVVENSLRERREVGYIVISSDSIQSFSLLRCLGSV